MLGMSACISARWLAAFAHYTLRVSHARPSWRVEQVAYISTLSGPLEHRKVSILQNKGVSGVNRALRL
jgi:hypothetical protein